jgi:hypothetical protein
VLFELLPDWFNFDAIADVWARLQAGDTTQAIHISRLLTIGLWYQIFFGDEGAIPE